MKVKITVVLSLLFCLHFAHTHAQYGSIVNYTIKDGLPSSQVYDIIQDDFGYLWFSTDKGLSRYNGYEFENFEKKDGLTDNVVFDFLKRPNGDIWCTTHNSTIFKISGRTPTFTPYEFNKVILSYGGDKITNSLYISDKGDFYIAYAIRQAFLLINRHGKVEQTYFLPKLSDTTNRTTCLAVLNDDRSDPFFFYDVASQVEKAPVNTSFVLDRKRKLKNDNLAEEAVYFKNHQTGVFIRKDAIVIEGRNQNQIIPLLSKAVIASGKLNEHQFWVGFNYGGACVYDLSGNMIEHFLPDKSVTQLFNDHQGNTWVSTLENGVFKLSNQQIFSVSTLSNRHIISIETGVNNDVYAGTYSGRIFKRERRQEFGLIHSCVPPRRTYIVYDPKRRLNYFSSKDIFGKNQIYAPGYSSAHLNIIAEDYLAFGTRGVYFFNLKEGKKTSSVFFSKLRVNDVRYFNHTLYGGGLHGLYISGIDNPDKITHILKGIRVDDLNTFGDLLVLGTNGNGLKFLNKQNKVVRSIEITDGLSSNYVSKTFSQNDSTLWVCTNLGVNRIVFGKKNQNYKIDRMNINDGLCSNEVWDILIQSDTVWVGTQSGLNYFTISAFNKIQSVNSDYYLQLESILINDSIPGVRRHSFSYYENKFEFKVLGISFRSSALEYRYKLKGVDQSWSYTKNRILKYSALPLGDYTLVVQVKGKGKKWSTNEIRYSFTIHPPFWKTWWFLTICIISLGAVVYAFFKIRVLTYNKDVVHEILRYILQKLRKEEPSITIKHNGNNLRLKTNLIHYIKTDRNYLELYTESKNYVIRSSISKFLETVPDRIEFLQVHRSYVVRIEHVSQKGKSELVVLNTTIPIGRKYQEDAKIIDL